MSEPISGNHNDLFDIEVHFEEITAILEGADISIKRTNVRVDAFRSLLNRFDTSISSWEKFNYLAFMVIALRKLLGKEKVK